MALQAKPDPIERGFFRETADGGTVFFPWGLTGRGYRLPDGRGKHMAARATRAARVLLASTVAAGVWGGHALEQAFRGGAPSAEEVGRALGLPLGLLALVVLAYAIWVSRFVEGCLPSDLQIGRDERLREAAALAGPAKVTSIGLILAALGLVALWIQPRAWWVGCLAVALGAGLAAFGRVLKRASRGDDARPPGPRPSPSASRSRAAPRAWRR